MKTLQRTILKKWYCQWSLFGSKGLCRSIWFRCFLNTDYKLKIKSMQKLEWALLTFQFYLHVRLGCNICNFHKYIKLESNNVFVIVFLIVFTRGNSTNLQSFQLEGHIENRARPGYSMFRKTWKVHIPPFFQDLGSTCGNNLGCLGVRRDNDISLVVDIKTWILNRLTPQCYFQICTLSQGHKKLILGLDWSCRLESPGP